MADHHLSLPLFSRLPVTVDLSLLLRALSRVAKGAWKPHFNAGYYDGEWSGVALISPADALTELSSGQGAPVEREPWQQDADWRTALEHLPLEIRSARLLRLGPGGRIHEHSDYDLAAPDADRRLHIPLFSPPHVDFMLDGQRVTMVAGECWFLDLARRHSVDNWGEGERVHLVLDCRQTPWLTQQIEAGLASTPAPGVGRAAEAFVRFRALVERDSELCAALQTITDSEAFIACTLASAAERGLLFSEQEIRSAMRQGRSRWNQQWKA